MFKMQVLHNKGNPKELKSKFSDKYQMQYSQKKKKIGHSVIVMLLPSFMRTNPFTSINITKTLKGFCIHSKKLIRW